MSRRSRSALITRSKASSIVCDVDVVPSSERAASAFERSNVIVTFSFAMPRILPTRHTVLLCYARGLHEPVLSARRPGVAGPHWPGAGRHPGAGRAGGLRG